MGPHSTHFPDRRQIVVLVLLLVAARLMIPVLDIPAFLPSALHLLRGASRFLWMAISAFA